MLRILFISFFALVSLASAHSHLDSLADRVLASTLLRQYGLAAQQAESLSLLDEGQGHFFTAMVALSRFDDLGDTASLKKIAFQLEKKSFSNSWWEALRLFQLGFCKASMGSTTSAAWNTRKAAKIFADGNTLESRAFAAIYGYYMEGVTAWVPFGEDKRPQMLRTLDSARYQSRWYWPLFATSLAWMHFDRKEYGKGLAIATEALRRAPGHPVFLQMKGDMLYRLGNREEARKIYEKSLADYAQRAPGSVRWWSAGGNVWRMAHESGDLATAQFWKERFESKEFEVIRQWMPESLMKALEELD